MAYKINFGNYPQTKNLYIVLNGITNVSTWNPTEVTGAVKVAELLLDTKDQDIFTPWIKQSLQVTFIRENETDFNDIIQGTDNTTYAIVVSNGTLELLEGGYLGLSEGAKLDFIGTLTMETYGEQYRIKPEVNLTFHDRIGFLDDELFEPKKNRLSIIEFLAEMLPSIITSKYVLLEWPYSDDTYSRPDEFFYDFAPWYGQTKSEVFEQFLKDHGLQMVCDFRTIFSAATTPYATECGCVLIRMATQFSETENTYYVLQRTDTVVGSETIYTYAIQTTTTIVSDEVLSELNLLPYAVANIDLTVMGNTYAVVFDNTEPGIYDIWIDTSEFTTIAQQGAYLYNAIQDLVDNYDNLTDTVIKFKAKTGSSIYDIDCVDTGAGNPVINIIDYSNGESTVTSYTLTINSDRNPLNTSVIPITENAAQWELFRKAKNIIAVHALEHEENLIFKGVISEDDFFPSQDYSLMSGFFGVTRHKYIDQLISSFDTIAEDVYNYIEGILPSTSFAKAYAGFYVNDPAIKEPGDFGIIRPFIFYPIHLYNTTSDVLLTITRNNDISDTNVYYLALIKDQDGNYRYWDGNSWETFTTGLGYLSMPSKLFEAGEFDKTETISITNETGQLYLAVFCVAGLAPAYLTSIKIESDSDEFYLSSIKLETTLYSNNRKDINIKTKFGNIPDVNGAELYYRNCISNVDYVMPLTLNYKSLGQTLLAHLSDMYGANYQVDRWYLSVKPKANDIKLYNPFEMENKVFMLLDGGYNLKTGVLDGKFAEVVFTGYAETWLWDDGDVLEWDDNTAILIG